jgi:hypothetical protein
VCRYNSPMSDGSRECLTGETSSLNPSGRCLPIRLTRSAMWVFIAGYEVTSCYDDRFSACHMAECLLGRVWNTSKEDARAACMRNAAC